MLACTLQSIFGKAIPSPERKYGTETALSELPYAREYFYVGGRYADNGKGTGEHVFKEQMYVEQLTQVRGASKKYLVILIHRAAQSGTVSD